MKHFLFLFTLILSTISFSQKTTEKVLDESCNCITDYKTKVRNYDEYLGMIFECMGANLYTHSEDLAEEMGIDVDAPNAMEAIGEKIGERLAVECPRFLELTIQMLGEDEGFREEAIKGLMEDNQEDEEIELEEELFIYETGVITEVSQTIPCTITLLNEDDETIKVLWLYRLSLDDQYVHQPNSLINKNVSIEYMFDDVYDPSKGAYTSKKVLFDLIINE